MLGYTPHVVQRSVGKAARGQAVQYWLMVAVLAGCTGGIETPGGDGRSPGPGGPNAPNAGSGAPGRGPGGPGGPGGPTGNGGSGAQPGGPPSAEEVPAPATRAARLTHTQWENTIRDLFELDGSKTFGGLLRSDPVQSGFLFENNSLTLEIDEALFTGYQRAAAEVATYVTTDAARFAKIAPAANSDATARARAFIEQFGLRAHRRPLDADEVSEYLTLFQMGSSLYTGMPAFEAGARVTIEAMLQSPLFLYRVESSDQASGSAVALSDYEIASRLSYMLWNTMPDQTLFDAAAAGALGTAAAVETQAQRMLEDARAEAMVGDFHRQLFEVERFAGVRPSMGVYPNAPAELGAFAAEEHERFVHDVVFEQQGGYTQLLTSSETFVNGPLARIYGLSGNFGTNFVKAQLDPAERRGIFTQIGFLALNATSVNPDPIHRGVFLARRIACMTISAPPANIPPLPEPEGKTNRETVEGHTEKPGSLCATCHATLINPLGFPFEHYDSIGAYRTEDNGHPVNAATMPLIGNTSANVDGAIALADALAASSSVHDCYTQHWLEFAYARPGAAEDEALVARLSAASLGNRLSVQELIIALVTSPAFLLRSTEELP
jgi:hypothetical protein